MPGTCGSPLHLQDRERSVSEGEGEKQGSQVLVMPVPGFHPVMFLKAEAVFKFSYSTKSSLPQNILKCIVSCGQSTDLGIYLSRRQQSGALSARSATSQKLEWQNKV